MFASSINRVASCLLILLIAFPVAMFAAPLKLEKGLGWASYRDLTSSQFSQRFKEMKRKGYLMIDVDAYSRSGGLRYSMVWRKNKDKRAWAEYRGMTSAEYNKKWKDFKKRGYRPIDIESYRSGGKQLYAGIWVKNKEAYAWSSKRNLTATQYGNYFKEMRKKKYRIVDMEAYNTGSGLRYSAIWIVNKKKIAWAQFRDMSRKAYQEKINEYGKKGYIVVDYENYKSGLKNYYAAIWEKRSGYATQVRTDRSEKQFANLWREYRDKGYRLIDFERRGNKYGGVWIENSSRYRYSRKGQIDTLMTNYRSANNLPGISIAVVRNGKMIYRRGFGWANTLSKKVAHGETVYSAASISKVFAGTLAAKFSSERRLRNGRAVSLNLNSTTRSVLRNVRQTNGTRVSLASRHRHTIAQLFAHLGCIPHYNGSPEPTTRQYTLAIDALPQIWNASFVSNCTRGTTRSYSTHAFTYLAAVLEKVTGRRSAQLIRSELAIPYKLNSLRVLYSSANVPANYERTVAYSNGNLPIGTANNSWKVFGGGIEISPVDLAWFGWKVLNGQIVRASARDNTLWKRVNPNQVNGLAWDVRSISGRRVAQHGGSFNGTLTQFRVYRDNGLVIAIMSNRRNHTSGSLGALTESVANVVLAP